MLSVRQRRAIYQIPHHLWLLPRRQVWWGYVERNCRDVRRAFTWKCTLLCILELGKTRSRTNVETREHVLWEHTVTEYKREPRRGEAKPLFSLDNGEVEVMACVCSSYLTGTIYHYFFSRCLANVRGTRTVSHRPQSVTVAIDWSASSRFDLWDNFRLLAAFTNFRHGRVSAYSRKQ